MTRSDLRSFTRSSSANSPCPWPWRAPPRVLRGDRHGRARRSPGAPHQCPRPLSRVPVPAATLSGSEVPELTGSERFQVESISVSRCLRVSLGDTLLSLDALWTSHFWVTRLPGGFERRLRSVLILRNRQRDTVDSEAVSVLFLRVFKFLLQRFM